jgi:hypothetical protein
MTDKTAARRERYAAAMDAVTGGICPTDLIDAVMAVADEELQQERERLFVPLHRAESENARLLAAAPAVQAPAADRAALREQIAEAALRAVETAMDDTLLPAAREKALVGIAAVLPAPTDRAAVLREAADRYAKLTDENEAYDREHGQLDEVARIQHETVRDVVTGLRRMADEAQQDGARS